MLHSRSTVGAQKRFCVLTVGRTGSTSLMNALGKFSDIVVPRKNMPRIGDELFHPKKLHARMKRYAELCGVPIVSAHRLMECFFAYNAGTGYAGFKTMPNWHMNFDAFVARDDIQFITLTRRDVPSTVASFLMAIRTNAWQRFGEPQPVTWTFVASRDGKRVLGNLAYVRQSLTRLSRVPNAIALAYEDLCNAAYRNEALDDFFGRPIRIENPKPPTSGRAYVENWDEFCAFIGEVPVGA
jgi:hypothetical protein